MQMHAILLYFIGGTDSLQILIVHKSIRVLSFIDRINDSLRHRSVNLTLIFCTF